MAEKSTQYINYPNIALILLVIILSCIIFYNNSRNVELRIALAGWGPQDYVNQKLRPEDFRNNWPSGILAYDNSLPMKIYYYLAKYLKIGPTRTMYPFMFIQTLLFIFSLAALSHTLFKNILMTLIAVIVLSQSSLAGLNLSRFGFGYYSYLKYSLYYSYATGFSLLGINCFLKDKYIKCSVFMAMAVYCHLIIGMFTFVFVVSYLVYKRLLFQDRAVRYGVYTFVLLILPVIIFLSYGGSLSTGGIPMEDWIKSTRIFSYHWYPLTMKLFTKNAHREFFPWVLSMVVFFVATRYVDIRDDTFVKISLGCIGILVMSIVGFILIEVYPVPTIIKISPQRSTGLISFFACVFWIYYLFRKAIEGGSVICFTAVFGLSILALSEPGITVGPMLILLYSDLREGHCGFLRLSESKSRFVRIGFLGVTGFVLLISLLNIVGVEPVRYIWSPLKYLNPFYGFDFLVRGGGFKSAFVPVYLVGIPLLTTLILHTYKNRIGRFYGNLIAIVIIFVCLSAVWLVESDKYTRWYNRNHERAASYMDLQLWVKNNTEVDALFMPDPTHYYGWRDFSERSSFGNLREWGYSGIVYRSEKSVYDEGVRRIKEFGIDIGKIGLEVIRDYPDFPYSDVLTGEVRKKYYQMDHEKLLDLATRYGIDYFIMEKSYMTIPVRLIPVYENEHFIIFAAKKFNGYKIKTTLSSNEIYLAKKSAKAKPSTQKIIAPWKEEGRLSYISGGMMQGEGHKVNALANINYAQNMRLCKRALSFLKGPRNSGSRSC
jgi:hypothetical protein